MEHLQSLSLVSTLSNPGENATAVDEIVSQTSQNSLIPADDSSTISQTADDDGNAKDDDDDSSYIQVVNSKGISSAPCSLKSVEDLVLVTKSVPGQKK